MRCPQCNKFVSLESSEPETDLDISDDLHIVGGVRCVRACVECGEELKEANFDVDEELEIPTKEGHVHTIELEEENAEAIESGGGRYKKNMCGFSLDYVVVCSNGCDLRVTGNISDELQASAWDEM